LFEALARPPSIAPRAKEGSLPCGPEDANFFALMKLRKETANAMRAINERAPRVRKRVAIP
jgi:hypothetical protein